MKIMQHNPVTITVESIGLGVALFYSGNFSADFINIIHRYFTASAKYLINIS